MDKKTSAEKHDRNGLEANGHVKNSSNTQKESKQALPQRKVYTYRNSVLTDLMEVNHLQTVYNISVAVCTLLLVNAAIYYLSEPEMFWKDIRIMKWGISRLDLFVGMWILLQLFAYFIYAGFTLWLQLRNRIFTKVVDFVFLCLFIASVGLLYTLTPYTVSRNSIPPITAFAIVAEQVRIFMKVYSFVRETVPRAMKYNPSKDGNQLHSIIPSLRHYTYFLFIPAFIYRESYPRTKEVRWRVVFYNIVKFLSCIFITYCVFMRFNVDIFKPTGLKPFRPSEAALTLAGAMVVGSMMMFLLFYGILHCWLNIFAELLRFGDREFYQDWWNSTSFSQYYRRWNTVVYDWLYNYVYIDMHRMGCSRSFSLVLVFIMSALVHEYVISMGLGFCYPVLMVIYSTIGVFILFLTQSRTSQFWNTFMWSMLFSGWGIIISLYSSEWYARVNCPQKLASKWDFFIPRSWDSSCHILS